MRELRIRLELATRVPGTVYGDDRPRWDLQFPHADADDELFQGLRTEEVHEYIAVRVNAAMDSLQEG